MAIRIRVLYFGQAREAAGMAVESLSLPNASSVRVLMKHSTELHERLKGMSGVLRIAVNEELAEDDDRLSDGDTVAFLPPIAGG